MPDGMVSAIKVFKLHPEKALRSFEIECEVLRNIRHRNITKVITSCSNLDFRALVMEYLPNGSLEDLLYSYNDYLGIKKRLDIMIDVACALDYLHHEYGLGGLVSTSSDVYSYGIMFMETFTRMKPVDEFFAGGMTLRLWVGESLPNEITKVIDMDLLRQGEELLTKDVQCLIAIMELALECTKESADERVLYMEGQREERTVGQGTQGTDPNLREIIGLVGRIANALESSQNNQQHSQVGESSQVRYAIATDDLTLLERFVKLKPIVFTSGANSDEAKEWISNKEKLFERMQLTPSHK
ncbi:hypothetical protein RJ640_002909, partial [Escallonia rubra]